MFPWCVMYVSMMHVCIVSNNLFVVKIQKNMMLISLFSTPLDNFHFHPTSAPTPGCSIPTRYIMACCFFLQFKLKIKKIIWFWNMGIPLCTEHNCWLLTPASVAFHHLPLRVNSRFIPAWALLIHWGVRCVSFGLTLWILVIIFFSYLIWALKSTLWVYTCLSSIDPLRCEVCVLWFNTLDFGHNLF